MISTINSAIDNGQVKTYTCGASHGVVYTLNGRRCSTLIGKDDDKERRIAKAVASLVQAWGLSARFMCERFLARHSGGHIVAWPSSDDTSTGRAVAAERDLLLTEFGADEGEYFEYHIKNAACIIDAVAEFCLSRKDVTGDFAPKKSMIEQLGLVSDDEVCLSYWIPGYRG